MEHEVDASYPDERKHKKSDNLPGSTLWEMNDEAKRAGGQTLLPARTAINGDCGEIGRAHA